MTSKSMVVALSVLSVVFMSIAASLVIADQTIDNPQAGSDYFPTSPIAANGTGTGGQQYTVKLLIDTTIVSEATVTADMDSNWNNTFTPGSSGWDLSNYYAVTLSISGGQVANSGAFYVVPPMP